jgi:hypothetical protein
MTDHDDATPGQDVGRKVTMINQVAIFDLAGKEQGVFHVSDEAFDALLSVSQSKVMTYVKSGENARRIAVSCAPHPEFAQSATYVRHYMEAAYAEPVGRSRAPWWRRWLVGVAR